MKRTEIINALIKKHGCTNYLEIGIYDEQLNFAHIVCENKTGVDPEPNAKATLCCTSDQFFRTNTEKFDAIFIDGLHHAEQVYKDIINALDCLADDGVIICHDMNPEKEPIQRVPRETREWTGDCWKAWVELRSERNDLNMFVINTDYGVGIIRKGSQQPIQLTEELTYDNLCKNREHWLNLISTEKFAEEFIPTVKDQDIAQ